MDSKPPDILPPGRGHIRMVPMSGSHGFANNNRPNGEIPPSLDLPKGHKRGAELVTGRQAKIEKETVQLSLSQVREEMKAYDNVPDNPHAKRLENQQKKLQKRLGKAEGFLQQWKQLDNPGTLQQLVSTKDKQLSKNAAALLNFRSRTDGLTDLEQQHMELLSNNLRDTLMTRQMAKQRGNNKGKS